MGNQDHSSSQSQPSADANALALSVPAGWKLVPIEPTEEMIVAATNHVRSHGGFLGDGRFMAMWSASLSAAPASTTPEGADAEGQRASELENALLGLLVAVGLHEAEGGRRSYWLKPTFGQAYQAARPLIREDW